MTTATKLTEAQQALVVKHRKYAAAAVRNLTRNKRDLFDDLDPLINDAIIQGVLAYDPDRGPITSAIRYKAMNILHTETYRARCHGFTRRVGSNNKSKDWPTYFPHRPDEITEVTEPASPTNLTKVLAKLDAETLKRKAGVNATDYRCALALVDDSTKVAAIELGTTQQTVRQKAYATIAKIQRVLGIPPTYRLHDNRKLWVRA